MSYLDLINLFWKEDNADSFSTTETRLYFLLLSLANRNRWQGEIIVSDLQLSSMVGVALNTFKRARDALHKRNLIEFTAGGRGYRNKCRYQLRYSSSCQVRCQPVTPIYNKSKNKDNFKTDGNKKGFIIASSDFD